MALKKHYKVILFVVLVVVLGVASHVFGWTAAFEGASGVGALRELAAENLFQAGFFYILLSVVGSVVLALPGVLFAVLAGSIFGPVMGTLLCWVAMTVGATLAFLVGRFFLKDSLKPRLAKYPALDKLLFSGIDRSYTYLLAITRLVPLFPFNVQNFAYGITDVSLGAYTLLSAVFMLPGVAIYTVGSAGLFDAENRIELFVLAGVLLAFSLTVAHVLKKKADLS
ncbi:MAG: TVP38/TMEM64 family protein [Atopobiaceae bacterium]|jgi:uncharacterized membrane protein YdjX (TVP38/TMEM64 family)